MTEQVDGKSSLKRKTASRTRIGIIGTAAGRGKSDDSKMSRPLFLVMVAEAERRIEAQFEWANVHLVSGGAAWSDHVAVWLYMRHPDSRLTLYLPCSFDRKFDPLQTCGKMANACHAHFKEVVKHDSLADLQTISRDPHHIFDNSARGFKARNSKLAANVDLLYAFTFGTGSVPTSPGTLDTWNKTRVNKTHISLASLLPLLHAKCKVWTDGFWGVEDCRRNPKCLFVFGDNDERRGKKGQAVIRDEPNAFGVATKKKPLLSEDAFYKDMELDSNKVSMDRDLHKLLTKAYRYDTVYFPEHGLGTGLSQLGLHAPLTLAYLNHEIRACFGVAL